MTKILPLSEFSFIMWMGGMEALTVKKTKGCKGK